MSCQTVSLYHTTGFSHSNPPVSNNSSAENFAVNSVADPGAFFSPIPRGVYDLRAAGKLQARDVEVLGLLLDYKGRAASVVSPRQDTLAERLRCSTDTIQRSLRRLESVGLIAAKRLRDTAGRLGRCLYDLAATLALMPRQAAKMRSGAWGAQNGPSLPADAQNKPIAPPLSMPQKCGLSEADKFVAKADNTAPAPDPVSVKAPLLPQSAQPDVVVKLISFGMAERIAKSLYAQHGATRCAEVIEAAAAQRRVVSKAAWCYRCLAESWELQKRNGVRPKAQMPYHAPSAAAAQVDDMAEPLALLPADESAHLETAARRELAQELPTLRGSLEAGRSRRLVLGRMREMLAKRVGGQPSDAPASAHRNERRRG